MFYIYKAATKKSLRQFIQRNFLAIQNKSSYYQSGSYYYIAVLSNTEITNVVNWLRLDLANSADKLVYTWANSELLDRLKFMQLESTGILESNQVSISTNGATVIRSYQALSEIMLVINLTPDSFSDGGYYANNLQAVMIKVEQALQDGVGIIDVGAESTRPNANFIDVDEEIERLESVILSLDKLKNKYDFKISLDSYKAEVVSKFLPYIDIVNDVSNQLPLKLIREITSQQKQYVLMHSLTVPAMPQVNLNCYDVTNELTLWFKDKLAFYTQHEINLQQIILDPGIGFNKTQIQSWQLLQSIQDFYSLGCVILVGHSRKSFLNKVTRDAFVKRDLESAVVSNHLAKHGVDYLRMHEYKEYLAINNVTNNLGVC